LSLKFIFVPKTLPVSMRGCKMLYDHSLQGGP
jgi:hypothetical protein